MTRFLKMWAIWMLVLVLPAQALASAAKISCGPVHQSIASPTLPSAHHALDDMGHATHQHEQIGDEKTHNAPDAPSTFKSAFCSDCAACCVGAEVMSREMAWTPQFTDSSVQAISPPSFLAGFIPARLERPPRHFLD